MKESYNRLINIISQVQAEAPLLNEAVKILTTLNVNIIEKKDYKLIEDFIVFVCVQTDTNKHDLDLLNEPLKYIRDNI